jgi:hypothetical protein
MYAHDAALGEAAGSGGGKSGAGGSAGASMAGQGGKAGTAAAGASAGAGGSSGASAGAGALSDPVLGETGLRISEILGFYSGDWGDMVLEQRGAEIWGVYSYSDGTIIGQITSEGIFAGWWSQLPTRAASLNAGDVEFRWSRSNAGVVSLDGRWRYGATGAWLENWDVDLVTDRTAPSDLTEELQDTDDFKRHP